MANLVADLAINCRKKLLDGFVKTKMGKYQKRKMFFSLLRERGVDRGREREKARGRAREEKQYSFRINLVRNG